MRPAASSYGEPPTTISGRKTLKINGLPGIAVVAVTVGVLVAVGVFVAVWMGVLVGVWVVVGDAVLVGVRVIVAVNVMVGVLDAGWVAVIVGVSVGVAVGPDVGSATRNSLLYIWSVNHKRLPTIEMP